MKLNVNAKICYKCGQIIKLEERDHPCKSTKIEEIELETHNYCRVFGHTLSSKKSECKFHGGEMKQANYKCAVCCEDILIAYKIKLED